MAVQVPNPNRRDYSRLIEEYEVVTVKFSEQEGCISNSEGDTITFNKPSLLWICAPGDVTTLGSLLTVSFANTVRSSASSSY